MKVMMKKRHPTGLFSQPTCTSSFPGKLSLNVVQRHFGMNWVALGMVARGLGLQRHDRWWNLDYNPRFDIWLSMDEREPPMDERTHRRQAVEVEGQMPPSRG